jgi:L-malate glycosyltransferase
LSVAAVHQFVSTLAPGDAVSNHTLEVQRVLRELGLESEVYARQRFGEMVLRGRPFRDYDGSGPPADTLLLYQAATGSVLAEFLARRAEGQIVNYHNVTPSQYFDAWEPHVAMELDVGRRQIAGMAARAALGICDSAFNEADLRAMGYAETTVVPILLDLNTFEGDVDGTTLDRLLGAKQQGGADWLFVGRLAPNKAQHDLVRALAVYRRLYDPRARLHLIGGPSSAAYSDALLGYVAALDLDHAVSLTGPVPHGVLAAHYRTADVYVCVSEHEGFCIPLLEAFHHRIPVVAYKAGAVPETLGSGGLLLRQKDPVTVAAAVARVLGEPGLRQRMVDAGAARLAGFGLERSRARFTEALTPLLEGTG